MSHEVYTTAAGKASMAFAGQTPWHGLGQKLTEDADLDTWIREAGLDYHLMTSPVIFYRQLGERTREKPMPALIRLGSALGQR